MRGLAFGEDFLYRALGNLGGLLVQQVSVNEPRDGARLDIVHEGIRFYLTVVEDSSSIARLFHVSATPHGCERVGCLRVELAAAQVAGLTPEQVVVKLRRSVMERVERRRSRQEEKG